MGTPLPYDKQTEDVVLGSIIKQPSDYEDVARFFTKEEAAIAQKVGKLGEILIEKNELKSTCIFSFSNAFICCSNLNL